MHLISYDIHSDYLRTKIAKTLIQYGLHRIQYSVFMGTLRDSTVSRLRKVLHNYTQDRHWIADDTVMILPLHQYSEDHISFLGKEIQKWSEIQGNLHTLVL